MTAEGRIVRWKGAYAMVLFNYSTRELTAKVVYYGPGICGKTTNLQFIHENLPGEVRGKMLSLATKTDRTLFFDFLPIDLGEIRGMKTRVQLYTVPGQVFYNETRKLVLKGVDGIVFVADSQETMLGANLESYKNLEDNLKAHGMKLAEMPHIMQFNKRDLPKLSSVEDMNAALNKYNAPFYESVATTGIGVQDTLKAIVKLVLLNLTRKYESKSASELATATASAPPAAAAAASTTTGPTASTATMASVGTDKQTRGAVHVANDPGPGALRSTGKKGGKVEPKPIPVAAATTPTMPPFAETEIDGLVDEVEDAPAPIAAAAESGVWMGEPDHVETASLADDRTFGSSVPLEDLLANDTPVPAPAAGEFEVDRGFDPEWERGATPKAAAEPAPPPSMPAVKSMPPASAVAPPRVETAAPIGELLAEVASDDDLFSDPSLEIAHLTEGQGKEIIVPVMLGEGPEAKRFKLAIRIRLQPID